MTKMTDEQMEAVAPGEYTAWEKRVWRRGYDAALAQQPPAEAQAQGGGEVVAQFYVSDKMEELCPIADMAPGRIRELLGNGTHDLVARTAPPSAPVGAIGDAIRHLSKWLDLNDCECEPGHQCGRIEVERTRDQLRALAQQPAADSPSFTAGDMADAAAQGFRDGVASVGAVGVEGLACRIENYHWDVADKPVAAQFATELRALAAQPGGSDNDR